MTKQFYKLTDSEKQKIFELVKKQVRNAKHFSESPALEYLFECREFLRFAIMAKTEEEKTNRLRKIESF